MFPNKNMGLIQPVLLFKRSVIESKRLSLASSGSEVILKDGSDVLLWVGMTPSFHLPCLSSSSSIRVLARGQKQWEKDAEFVWAPFRKSQFVLKCIVPFHANFSYKCLPRSGILTSWRLLVTFPSRTFLLLVNQVPDWINICLLLHTLFNNQPSPALTQFLFSGLGRKFPLTHIKTSSCCQWCPSVVVIYASNKYFENFLLTSPICLSMSNFPFPEKIKIKKEGMQLWWNGVNASDTLEFKLEVMVRILPLEVVRNGYLYPIFFFFFPLPISLETSIKTLTLIRKKVGMRIQRGKKRIKIARKKKKKKKRPRDF